MSPELLLDHFDCISEAPDAIPRLRRFVLDLAMRGKLMEQNPNDESAAVLLTLNDQVRRTTAEKDRRADTGRQAQLASENRWDIPPSWEWSALADLVLFIDYRGKTPTKTEKGVRLITAKNVKKGFVNASPEEFISEPDYRAWMTRGLPKEGDILFTTEAPMGNAAVVRWSDRFALAQRVICFRPYSAVISDFLTFHLLSEPFQSILIKTATGLTAKGIKAAKLARLPVAVPPLAEQHRIITRVNELMTLCDRLEEICAERETRRDRLTAATLHRLNCAADAEALHEHARLYLNHLPRLTVRSAHMQRLRQTLLNLAVQGKLVPQDANDEPASELLKRVVAEKVRLIEDGDIKKQKPLPPVQESTTPFILPRGWSWVRLGDLSKLVTSGSRDWAKFYSNDGAIFVRMGNLSRDSYQLRLNNIQRVKPPADSEGARTKLAEGDILISITGEVGLLGLIPPNFGKSYINQHTCLVRPMDELRSRYLPELFRSPFAQNQFDEPQRGLKNSFRLTDVTHFLVPLPPLAEQSRIIAKIDELMAVCDRLERQLTDVDVQSSEMLESVLYHALMTPQAVSNNASPTWNAQAHA